MTKKQYKVIAFLLGIGLLIIFLLKVDIQQVGTELGKVGWPFATTLFITGIGYALAAQAWWLCLGAESRQLSLGKLFVYRQIGETLTTINPANIIVGETAKVFLLNRTGVTYEKGISSILLSRALIFLSLLVIAIPLPILLVASGIIVEINWMQSIAFIFVIGLIGLLFYGMIHPKLFLFRFFQWLTQKTGYTFLKKQIPAIKRINQLLQTFYKNHRFHLILALVLSALHWIMGAIEFYILLQLLGVKVSLTHAILLEIGVTVIKSLGAFVPGQIGIEEYGNQLMLQVLHLNSGGLWLVISVLRRARQLFWLFIGGLFCWWIYAKHSQNGNLIHQS